MLRFEGNQDEKRALAARINELTGERAVYTKMPRCAYQFGIYFVERDGSLTVEGDPDRRILKSLLDEGLIRGELPEETAVAEPDTESGEPEAGSIVEEVITIEDGGMVSTGTREDEVTVIEETVEAGGEEPAENSGDGEQGSSSDAQESDPSDAAVTLQAEFPAQKHTVTSLRNLIYLLYARGSLVSKATGGHFGADQRLVEELEQDQTLRTQEDLRRFLSGYAEQVGEGIHGLALTPEKVIFSGFPEADADHNRAFLKLAELMNRQAITQKRIQPKEVDETNEKFAFRTWAVRIGMGGADMKGIRKLLMENLTGNSAFRTEADAEKWKAKYGSKAKADAGTETQHLEGTETEAEV